MKYIHFALLLLALAGCKQKKETTRPIISNITESVYASGQLKSKNQYQVYPLVSGSITTIFVKEGDTVKKGQPLLTITAETQRLNRENAALAAEFTDLSANQGKLDEAKAMLDLARNKLQNDSLLYARQKSLWEKQIGSKTELEQRELMYENSKSALLSAQVRLRDLKRQLEFSSGQAQKNLEISSKLERDYTVKSEIEGVVYSLNKEQGEFVSTQTPLAIIGDASDFVITLQIDEYDILKVKENMQVLVTMDSYKGDVFEARVSRVLPLMDPRNKTFTAEAVFVKGPLRLYPGVTLEANIVINKKQNALLLPRSYVVGDSIVMKSNGEKVRVTTGLRDLEKIEILSGVGKNDELQKPL